jgi:protein SCO1/2
MSNYKPQRPQIPLPVTIAGMVLMLAGVLAARYLLTPQGASTSDSAPAHYLKDAKPISAFSLVDDNQQPFDPARLQGKWTFMFFGYTNCPDVCPTTLLVMKSVWGKMPAAAKTTPSPQMVFVSVDPDRDTPQRLKKYVHFFNQDFIGVTGKANDIDKLTRQVGVRYGFDDAADGKGYTVNHSAQIILIDPQGKMRAVLSPPHKVDDILQTYLKIRAYYNQVKS